MAAGVLSPALFILERSHLHGCKTLNVLTLCVPWIQARLFDRETDEPSHFHINENRWKKPRNSADIVSRRLIWCRDGFAVLQQPNGLLMSLRGKRWLRRAIHARVPSSSLHENANAPPPPPRLALKGSSALAWFDMLMPDVIVMNDFSHFCRH